MDRKSEIHNLLCQIMPLQSEKILIGTKLSFDEENYLKSFDEAKKQEIISGQEALSEIDKKLQPLQISLRKLQIKYMVEYRGQLHNPRNNTYYWETYVEEFNFQNDCEINTFENGWRNYKQIPNSSELLEELYHFLLMHRFSQFTILNVSKLT